MQLHSPHHNASHPITKPMHLSKNAPFISFDTPSIFLSHLRHLFCGHMKPICSPSSLLPREHRSPPPRTPPLGPDASISLITGSSSERSSASTKDLERRLVSSEERSEGGGDEAKSRLTAVWVGSWLFRNARTQRENTPVGEQ